MPRLLKLRVAALERIAHELRFAPAAAARRHTVKAEKLATMIDPSAVYPEDFVVFHITGFRPEIAQPELIPGDAILRDLAGLLDRLSRRAAFKPEELSVSAWLRVDDLLKRWGVSRKTIERLRPRGLIGRRVSLARGKAMNVFAVAIVKSIESREGLAGGKRARPRPPKAESKDSEPPKPKGAVTPQERRLVERALRLGVKSNTLAKRISKSKATVFRTRQRQLADRCRAVRMPIPAGAAEIIEREGLRFLAEPVVCKGLGAPGATSLAEHVADAVRAGWPDPLTERTRAFAYWTLIARAQNLARGLDRTRPAALVVDRIITDLRWASLLKLELIRAEQMLLLRTIEGQVGSPLLELPPDQACVLLARGIAALSAAVDRFDPTAGRVAGVASMEVSRVVTRWQAEQRGRDATVSLRAQPIALSAAPLDDWTNTVNPWQVWTNPAVNLRASLAHLSEADRVLLSARYGVNGSCPRDITELAEIMSRPARIVVRLLHSAERASAAVSSPRPPRKRRRTRSDV